MPSNLPPGCTDRDIERNAGTIASCDNCGLEVDTDTLSNDGLCPRCQNEADRHEPLS